MRRPSYRTVTLVAAGVALATITACVGGPAPPAPAPSASAPPASTPRAPARPRPRPLPGPEPGPTRADCQALAQGVGSPRSGAQTAQYRPSPVADNRQYALGFPGHPHAVWRRTGPVSADPDAKYPVVLNRSGPSYTATNTCLLGGQVLGNIDQHLDVSRNTLYTRYHGGIEQGISTDSGYAVIDGTRVSYWLDGYRASGLGDAYLKRLWMADIWDDCWEVEEVRGDVFIYDSLCEGTVTGIAERGNQPHNDDSGTYIDGLLMWIKPVFEHPKEAASCNSAEGCAELAATSKMSYGIWKGDATSTPRVEVRNSLFRVDRRTTFSLSPAMAFPCTRENATSSSPWGDGSPPTRCVYDNVKLLWTGPGAYPGALPVDGRFGATGTVELVSGPRALHLWQAAVNDWKADHGY